MSDVNIACGEACAGCNDECAACSAQMCADCGGCDHQRKLNVRARAATASLALHQIGAGVPAEFGFNPRQLRGPDGRWIKMGGAGSAGGKPRRVSASRADRAEVDAHGVAEGTRAADLRDAQTGRIRASKVAPAIPRPRESEENGIAARVKTTRNDNGTTTYRLAGKERDWTTVEAEDLADALDAVAAGGSVPPPIPGRVVSDGYNRRTVGEVQPFRNNKGGVTLTVGRDKPSGEPGDMDMSTDEARELAKLLRETAGQERSDGAARKAERQASPEHAAAVADAERRERRREAARARRQAAKDEQLRQAMGVDQDSESQAHNPANAPLTKRQRDMEQRFDRLAGEHATEPQVARWRDKAVQLTGDMDNARNEREREQIREQMDQVQAEFTHAMAGAKAAAAARAAGGDERDAAIAQRRAGLQSRADRTQKLIDQAGDELAGMPKYRDALIDPYIDERNRVRARIRRLKDEQKGYRDKIEAAEKDHDTKLVYNEQGDLVGVSYEPPPGRPDTGPDPSNFGQFRPTPDEEWALQERRLRKRTPQLDPDADFQPGDVVPTSDGRWQEILPGQVRERFGEKYVNVEDDAKGYRHTETVTNIRSRVRRYAAEKAWRDAGGSKDRFDGKVPVEAAPAPERPSGMPEVGEDGKFAKPVEMYARMPDGSVETRTSRNPYQWIAEYSWFDKEGNERGWVSWHRTRGLAERGNLTGDQRKNVRVKAVHPVTYSDPSEVAR